MRLLFHLKESKHFRQDGYSDNYINFLNKASVFVVWMDEQEGRYFRTMF